MRVFRCLWVIPLVLTAAAAAADVEPSATRIVINGESRIYRTYGWAEEPEVFAPIAKQLQRFGLVSDWQPGQEQATLGWDGAVTRVPVARSRFDIRVDRSRNREIADAEALEMGGELFLPVRATVRMMGGTVTWDAARRSLVVQLRPVGMALRSRAAADSAPEVAIRTLPADTTPGAPVLPSGPGALVTRLEWSESGTGLTLDVEATAPIRAQVLRLENPTRLVIDFSPAKFALAGLLEPRGAVRGVRTGQFQPDVARLVLDLGGARLTATGLPATAKTRLSIKLAVAGAPSRPAAVVPRSSVAKKPASRARRLASRGGFVGRDVERLKELIQAGGAILAGKIICIDAGHGGSKPGARGFSGLWEKDLTLQMALEAKQALEAVGATVIMTRTDDVHLSLDERVDVANQQGAHLFISIHCNSMPRLNMMSGTETYYCTPHSLDLARALHPELVGVMGGRDGGVRRRGFFVVRKTTMPSVLLEVGYINHSGDEQKLSDVNYQRSVGEAIRDGVVRYFRG